MKTTEISAVVDFGLVQPGEASTLDVTIPEGGLDIGQTLLRIDAAEDLGIPIYAHVSKSDLIRLEAYNHTDEPISGRAITVKINTITRD